MGLIARSVETQPFSGSRWELVHGPLEHRPRIIQRSRSSGSGHSRVFHAIACIHSHAEMFWQGLSASHNFDSTKLESSRVELSRDLNSSRGLPSGQFPVRETIYIFFQSDADEGGGGGTVFVFVLVQSLPCARTHTKKK